MSALLCKWLNNELGLGSAVNSIERDFSNGYNFAEVLHKLGCLSAQPTREEQNGEDALEDLVSAHC